MVHWPGYLPTADSTADRGAHKLGPGHKSQSNYSELLSTGQRRHWAHTQIHRHSDRDTHRISSGAGQEEAVHNKWRSRSIGGSSSGSSAWRHATSIFVQRMLQGVRASTTTWDEDEDEAGDDEAVWMRIGSCICKMLIAPGRPVAAASASASPSLATATRVRLWRIRHA